MHTIDGDLEYHNVAEPSTASCPLLPGQQVNVLDVPVQTNLVAGRNVSSTSLESIVFTLDPRDKYLPPGVRRASTYPSTRTRKPRHHTVYRLPNKSEPAIVDAGAPCSSTSSCDHRPVTDRQRSLLSMFHKIRSTRSAGSNAKSHLTLPRGVSSRNGHSTKADVVPEVPKLPDYVTCVQKVPPPSDLALPMQRPSTARTSIGMESAAMNTPANSANLLAPLERMPPRADRHTQKTSKDVSQNDHLIRIDNSLHDLDDACNTNNFEHLSIDDTWPGGSTTSTNYRQPYGRSDRSPRIRADKNHVDLKVAVGIPVTKESNLPAEAGERRYSQCQHNLETAPYTTTSSEIESSRFSYAFSETFSPGLASNSTQSGQMSPLYLSQPETPLTHQFDFEDDYDPEFLQLHRNSQSSLQLGTHLLDFAAPKQPSRAPPPPPRLQQEAESATSRQVDNILPSDDHASILTIRERPSRILDDTVARSSPSLQADRQGRVQTWNDGSEHLLDDLGYLGELII